MDEFCYFIICENQVQPSTIGVVVIIWIIASGNPHPSMIGEIKPNLIIVLCHKKNPTYIPMEKPTAFCGKSISEPKFPPTTTKLNCIFVDALKCILFVLNRFLFPCEPFGVIGKTTKIINRVPLQTPGIKSEIGLWTEAFDFNKITKGNIGTNLKAFFAMEVLLLR